MRQLETIPYSGKFEWATGNFNDTYQDYWVKFASNS